MSTLSPAGFDKSLDLLAEHLRARAVALRPHVFGAGRPGQIAEAVSLAFDAAYLGDQHSAELMIERAEALVRALPARPRKPAAIVRRGLRGQQRRWADAAVLIAATDASFKHPHVGWGYVSSAGHWGCAGGTYRGMLNPNGRSGAMISELRAVHMLLTDLDTDRPMTLLIDSRGALRFLRAWQSGRVGLMPNGYSLRPRFGAAAQSTKPTLVRLAEQVASRPGLRFEHVAGHSGHPLNEAADGLAGLARRCIAGDQDGDVDTLTARAQDLAAAFLHAWHSRPGAG
ncbi:RNase H family protein [Thermomonospora sp. CIF 1]|uniref:RNase H family protein n=1 Tax=Thermomonospora sp. CIF 1 TaxID=1916083 RepID=UPI000CC32574|nr:RNase H family protein [Thermomonospora sp. CIF 1]PKK16234.1 MAG: hypothetical protein BUE48_000125 [Thermomonospora sp. CIF 1]